MRSAALWALSLLALAGCRDRFVFVCADDSQCLRNGVHGSCMASPVDRARYCVFPDPACVLGRWDETAGPSSEAGICVDVPDLGVGGGGGADFSIPANADLSNLDASIDLAGCPGFTGTFYGVWGASQSDIWAVGSGGTIWHFRGAAPCEVQRSGVNYNLRAVWGRNANDVYVVGDHATLLHSVDKGANWLPASSGPTSDYDFWAVSGTSSTTYAAVEQFGTPQVAVGALWSTATTDGRQWMNVTAPLVTASGMSGINALNAIWAVDASSLWVGGGNVESYHLASNGMWMFNGGPAPKPSGHWSSFTGVGARLLASASDGEIWRLDSGTWTRAFNQATQQVCQNGIYAMFAVPGRAYAVGWSGCIAVSSSDGMSWSAFDYARPTSGPNNPYNDNYNGVWIDPVSQLVLLVGQDVSGQAVVRQNPPTP